VTGRHRLGGEEGPLQIGRVNLGQHGAAHAPAEPVALLASAVAEGWVGLARDPGGRVPDRLGMANEEGLQAWSPARPIVT